MCLPVIEDEGCLIGKGSKCLIEAVEQLWGNLCLLDHLAVKPDHKTVRCDGR